MLKFTEVDDPRHATLLESRNKIDEIAQHIVSSRWNCATMILFPRRGWEKENQTEKQRSRDTQTEERGRQEELNQEKEMEQRLCVPPPALGDRNWGWPIGVLRITVLYFLSQRDSHFFWSVFVHKALKRELTGTSNTIACAFPRPAEVMAASSACADPL